MLTRILTPAVFALSLLLCPLMAGAADLVIYDDALANGFINLSWPDPQPNPDQNFAADFHQHSGNYAIFYKAHDWNGLSFGRPGNGVSTVQYPQLRFWVRGDAGGERLTVHLQNNNTLVASAPLDQFVDGGAIGRNVYREVVIRFADPPLSYSGTIDRIDLQDASGNDDGNQQWVFVDDVRLVQGSAPDDDVFADGFDDSGGAPSAGLSPAGLGLFQRLHASQSSTTLVGHQASTIAGVGWRHWQFPDERSDFHDVSARYPALYGWELEPRLDDPGETLDYVGFALTRGEAAKARAREGLNSFVIHMQRLDNGGSAWTVAPANYCQRLVTNGNLNDAYNAKLDKYVSELLPLRDAGNQPIPFLLRPFHEADGGWFWWGKDACSDADFKALFRYTVQYLRQHGLGHMLAVYSPALFTSQAQYLARYPGDDVVDVIAMDQYLRGANPDLGVTDPAFIVNQLKVIQALARKRHKIAAWAEAGQLNLTSPTVFSQFRQIVSDSGGGLGYLMFWANYGTDEFYVPHNASPAPLRNDFNAFLAPPFATAGQYPSLYP